MSNQSRELGTASISLLLVKQSVPVSIGILIGWVVSGIYAFSVHANLSDAWIALIHTIYILVVIFVELPRSERSFTYQIFIYICHIR